MDEFDLCKRFNKMVLSVMINLIIKRLPTNIYMNLEYIR